MDFESYLRSPLGNFQFDEFIEIHFSTSLAVVNTHTLMETQLNFSCDFSFTPS